MIKISTINEAISNNEVQVLDSSIYNGHEKILFCKDTSTNLKAIIAVHSTKLGPGLGGCRMWDYKNQNEALNDVLRLSRGMTYKASITGLNLGGGKAVIIGDSKKDKTKELMESFGEFVESLGGKYITAEDVGMMNRIATAVAPDPLPPVNCIVGGELYPAPGLTTSTRTITPFSTTAPAVACTPAPTTRSSNSYKW